MLLRQFAARHALAAKQMFVNVNEKNLAKNSETALVIAYVRGCYETKKIAQKKLHSHREHSAAEENNTENDLFLCVHSVNSVPLCEIAL